MRILVLLLSLLTAACASPAPIAPPNPTARSLTPVGEVRSPAGDVLTLYAEPCPQSMYAQFPGLREGLQRAGIRMADGRTYVGCYGILGDAVLSIWDDGDQIAVPLSSVRQPQGAL